MMNTAIFTICSRNYLAYALTLRRSVEAEEPGCTFYIYLADDPPDAGASLPPNVIPVAELDLPDLASMAFRYTVMEFNTAIKADCFLDLLTRRGFGAAIYLDPDIRLFAPLEEVHSALSGGASAVLTPHILGPLPDDAPTGEIDILKSGVFNLGFAAFAKTEESLSFLRWWAGHLHQCCYSAPDQGLFVDQRFVDIAPGFIGRLGVIRYEGYNVAYWNLPRRRLERAGGQVLVSGAPLVFFHYSGVDPGNRDIVSKHVGAAGNAGSEIALELISAYLDELSANGHAVWSGVPYAWARFRDGSPILPPMRRHPPETGTPEDWFAAPDTKYWNTPDPRVDQKNGRILTRLMMGFWEMRADLQAAFPIGTEAGRWGLYTWFCRHGVREYPVPDTFVPQSAAFSAPIGRGRSLFAKLAGR